MPIRRRLAIQPIVCVVSVVIFAENGFTPVAGIHHVVNGTRVCAVNLID
jgi:hypothetical protein